MLKVDADSWHMRTCKRKFGDTYQPRNLCRYFWSFILALFRTAWDPTWLALCLVGSGVDWLLDGDWAGRKTRIAGMVLLSVLAIAGVVLILGYAGFLLYLLIFKVIIHFWGWRVLWWFLVGIGGTGAGLGFIIGAIMLVAWSISSDERHRQRGKERREKVKQPQGDSLIKLAWHYLWAKKKKICPLIEVI